MYVNSMNTETLMFLGEGIHPTPHQINYDIVFVFTKYIKDNLNARFSCSSWENEDWLTNKFRETKSTSITF